MLANPNIDLCSVIPTVDCKTVLTPTIHPAYIKPAKTHSVTNRWEIFFQKIIFC